MGDLSRNRFQRVRGVAGSEGKVWKEQSVASLFVVIRKTRHIFTSERFAEGGGRFLDLQWIVNFRCQGHFSEDWYKEGRSVLTGPLMFCRRFPRAAIGIVQGRCMMTAQAGGCNSKHTGAGKWLPQNRSCSAVTSTVSIIFQVCPRYIFKFF